MQRTEIDKAEKALRHATVFFAMNKRMHMPYMKHSTWWCSVKANECASKALVELSGSHEFVLGKVTDLMKTILMRYVNFNQAFR